MGTALIGYWLKFQSLKGISGYYNITNLLQSKIQEQVSIPERD